MKSREEKAKWDRKNAHNLVPCALCGELGLPDYYSDCDDDNEYAEILTRYSDGACRLDGELLCADCKHETDGRMMQIEESTSRRLNLNRRMI